MLRFHYLKYGAGIHGRQPGLLMLLAGSTRYHLLRWHSVSCIAIFCCSLVNYFLGNSWVFAEDPQNLTLRTYDMRASSYPDRLNGPT